jgi:hypothetical protein
LDIITKPTNAHKYIKVYYIINIILLLHDSATLTAILREMRYKGWAYRDVSVVCVPMHRCKRISLKIHDLNT